MRRLALLVVPMLAVACGGGSSGGDDPGTRRITRAGYGDEWPLTVDSGVLSCQQGTAVVFTAPDGTAYGVNGMAADYEEIEPIWAADPTGVAPKKNIGPLIDDGLDIRQAPDQCRERPEKQLEVRSRKAHPEAFRLFRE